MIEVDASGRSCPIPVLMAKKAMDESPAEEIAILVDTESSRENVSRLARSRGYEITEQKVETGCRLLLRRPG